MIAHLKFILNKWCRKILPDDQYVNSLRKDGVQIGRNCSVHKSVSFGSEPWLISIGDNTRLTKGVQFVTHDGGLWTLRNLKLVGEQDVKYGAIHIGSNCNISWDVTIMPGVKIGNNVVVAAGAVVTKDIPDGTVWGGVPAHQIETIEEYATKIRKQCVPTFSMTGRDKLDYLKKHRPDLFQ